MHGISCCTTAFKVIYFIISQQKQRMFVFEDNFRSLNVAIMLLVL